MIVWGWIGSSRSGGSMFGSGVVWRERGELDMLDGVRVREKGC